MRVTHDRGLGEVAKLAGLCTLALLLAAPSRAGAMCDQALLGAGAVRTSPRSSSGPLVVSEIGGQPVDMPVPSSGVKALDANTLVFLVECERDEHLKFRFVMGVPPKHKLTGSGSLSEAGVIGEGRQWSPTLLAIYTFLSPDQTLRPFVGAGFNYTFFREARITNDAFRADNFGPNAVTSVSLKPSWNLAATAGLALRLDKRWFLEAAASYAPIKARITVTADNTALGVPITAYSDLKNRTVAGSVTLNYRLDP